MGTYSGEQLEHFPSRASYVTIPVAFSWNFGEEEHYVQWGTQGTCGYFQYTKLKNIAIDKQKSNSLHINYRAPQGSILGPLLYLTYYIIDHKS